MIDPSQVRVTDDAPWPALLVQDGNHADAAWVSVHSRRDPKRDAARQLDAAGADASSVVIVIGLGLGYLLDVLEERDWRGTVVALEPEPALADRHLLRRDWGTWTGTRRLTVLRGPEYGDLDALAPGLDPNRAEVVAIINPTLARLNRQGVEDALRRATGLWFGARANQEAKRQNGGRYLLNTLRNAPALAREADAGALLGRFAGVPAILVAAGPSLDGNLPAIAAGRDRALVVAVDTALRPLLAAGIEPDLVVGVDPTEANARHLAELPRCETTYFVSEGSLDPEAWRAFEGRIFAFRVTGTQPWPWLQAGGIDRAKLRAWGSVLTTAFDLTLGMGCNPIVFTGADLGFTHDRPYARGTTYEEEWAREQAWGQTLEESWAMRLGSWPDLREPGVDGRLVRTAAHLVAFRDWIAAEAAKATGRTVVNATPGGILVGDGIALQPVERALAGSTPLAPSVRGHIADAYRTSARPTTRLSPPTIGHIDGWATGVGLDRESIVNAVDRTWSASAVDAARALGDSGARRPWWSDRPATHAANDGTPASSTMRSPDPSSSDLASSDAAFLRQLAATGPLTLVRLRAPEQDLLAELRAHVPAVLSGSTLAVVDELGTSVGTQVRRALDELLCERPDLSLEYRRFVDHQSRVSVLRAIAAHADPGGFQTDAGKWHPDHRAVADRLVPLLMETFAPRSIVDIGCGAGYWLQAFASLGAMRLGGVTPHMPEDGPSLAPVVRSWMRHAPLGRIPPPARRYDVCLCLEVAQHVAPAEQDALLESCAAMSDVVVFSSRPPGAPGGGPHDRPLPYWAEKFWRLGYVLDAGIRRQVERRWSHAQSVYDGLVAFRRIRDLNGSVGERGDVPARTAPAALGADASVTAAVLHGVWELYEQWLQKIWWSVLAEDRNVPPAAPPEYPRVRLTAWPIPRVRLAAAPGGGRLFRFRSDAARLYLTHPAATLSVLEDGRPLPAHDGQPVAAGWSRWRDEVTIRPADGSDPRGNGREYALVIPTEIAWLESQPPAVGISDGID